MAKKPAANKPNPEEPKAPVQTKPAVTIKDPIKTPAEFPYSKTDDQRLKDYEFFRKLFDGDHFHAFRVRIENKEFGEQYAKIRYLYVNYAGMISKIVADMLFGEAIQFKCSTKEATAWCEDFVESNNLRTLLYESELTNSSLGDAVFKLRTQKRRPADTKNSVILETCPPSIYFPIVDEFNVNGEPVQQDLAWKFTVDGKEYLRREIHTAGKIYNRIYMLQNGKIGTDVSTNMLEGLGLVNEQDTGIDQPLVFHVPNWRTTDRWNGYSDYYDLDSLFFAINNRLSMIDNVLDKHTDPILFVPPGVIDENGKVKKDNRVIEVRNDDDKKPEYIVWDASLENAFKEIEKMVEFVMMIGEVSPDVLGLGQGVSDSGRALKYKLIRTIAKVSRKKMYYDHVIKQIMLAAMKLSQANQAGVGEELAVYPGKPETPDIIWKDGLPTDENELIDIVTKQIDAGVTSKKDGIMMVHDIDENAAEKKLKEIDDESKLEIPPALVPNTDPFKKNPPTPPNPPAPPAK